MSTSNEFGNELKLAKRRLNNRDPDGSLFFLNRASEWAATPGGRHLHKRGILLHRHAVIEAIYGDPYAARQLFELAVELIEDDDPVARAILLRDFGNFELLQGSRKLARTKIKEALGLLTLVKESSERVEIELIVTNGFMARTDLNTTRHAQALDTLREVARALKGYRKPEYELANLAWLINNLPVGTERQVLIVRAVVLCIKLKQKTRAGEFTALLGGKPSRKAYRFISRS